MLARSRDCAEVRAPVNKPVESSKQGHSARESCGGGVEILCGTGHITPPKNNHDCSTLNNLRPNGKGGG